MRRLFLALLVLPLPVAAAPFVLSDPLDPAVTHCGVFMNGAARIAIAVTAQGEGNICKYDLATTPSGTHRVSMTAINANAPGGPVESEHSAPLGFTLPLVSAPRAPAGLRLAP